MNGVASIVHYIEAGIYDRIEKVVY